MATLRVHRHSLLLLIPLVTQNYPLEKGIIYELKDHPGVHVGGRVLALGILYPDLIGQLKEFMFVLADIAHELNEEPTEYLPALFEVFLLALGLLEIEQLSELVN